MKRITSLLFVGALLLVLSPGTALFAQDGSRAVAEIDAKIAALQAQIEQLRKERQEIVGDRRESVREAIIACRELKTQLRRGMRSDEVTELQELLAADPDVYPEALVTGFFGELTEEAVIRFQRKHGISPVGEVGPITRIRIHAELMGKRCKLNIRTATPKVPDMPPIPSDIRAGSKDHKVTLCHKPSDAAETIEVSIRALLAHIGHGDSVGACGNGDAGSGTTTPDTTAPALSDVSASSTASTSATISWTTSESATSKVYYGTTASLSLGSAASVMDAANVTSHTMSLSGLTASTTYYFVVESTDVAGNSALSSEMSFTTPN